MKNKLFKRLLSFVLSLAIVFGMLPSTVLTASASNDTVYISVSFDGEYQNNVYYTPVKLSDIAQIDLDTYGLGDYKYDADGDGSYETTVLHLYVYAHTQLFGLDWADVHVSGSAGSIFFERGIFGFSDCNLNYYVNGEYPLQAEGWGATADICALKGGDFVDVAGFTSWGFFGDSNSGFKYFTDENGNISHSFTAKQNETFTVNLTKTMQDMTSGSGTLRVPHSSDVYYSKTAFDSSASYVTTDSDGKADITFAEAGTWYLWSNGDYGLDMDPLSVVNAPAYAMVTVEGAEATPEPTPEPTPTPAPPANNAPALAENYASGTGTATITLGEEYSINLADVFTDDDGDTLAYYCNDTALTDAVYSITPAEAGTQTFVFKANDGKADSAVYTVTLTVTEVAKTAAKLSSLVLYRQVDGKNSPLIAAEGAVLPFSPENSEYIITQDLRKIEDKNNNKMFFCAVPENDDDTVTLYCAGYEDGVDIKSTADVFKSFAFITGGKNEFKIVVSAQDENVENTTYNFTVYVVPTLANNTTVESVYPVYLTKSLSVNNKTVEITVPSALKEITVNVKPKSENCTVTFNGDTSNKVDITDKDKIEIVVAKDGMSETYTYNLKRVSENFVKINTVPEDAQVKVTVTYKGGAKNYVLSKDVMATEGGYPLIFNGTKIQYSYTVTKDGYTPTSGTISNTDEVINVTLTKEIPTQPTEITDVDWKNFRNSDVNMAITSVKTPTDKIALKWNKTLGTGWGSSPSVPIIVDNKIVVMSGKKLYMLGAESGEIVKEADMVSAPNFGYTPPTYANGMIFCPLSNGTVQAFNATTLESLWVYTDPLGGQSLSPIAYSTAEVDDRTCGYIYTGFWNGESGDANYVCIDVTDYDTDNKTEPKTAVWSHKQNGGFYWAGAVVVGDAVIVGTDDGGAEGADAGSYLYSFNKKSGEILSKIALAADAGDQRSSIAYENGTIYFTTKGGYLYSAKVNSDGTVTGLKGVNYNAQITSTPVVYKGRIYFGIGSGIRTDGSEGSFVVADADTLEEILIVEMKGYPQGSALLSTAYEADGYLYFYMTYNDKPGGISLIKVKTDAQTANDTQLVEIYDAAGFEEFSIASVVCDENGTLYYKNDSANLMAIAPATTSTVVKLIDEIGTVTLESEAAIKAAREAYEALNETEKADVTNYETLVKAEETFAALVQAEADKTAADEVIKLIENIGKIKLENYYKIEKARKAYDKLTDNQKKLVTNFDDLENAEETAVKQVEDQIDEIGEVDIDSAEDIAEAKKAYNYLPEYLQKKVDNYDDLKAAEKELKKLREEALALLAEGKLVLTKTELLELKEDFEKVTENTGYDAVLALLRTFYKLGETQQLALENSDAVKLAQKIVAKHNHNNAYTGVKVDGLEWNIRLVVEETDNETALNGIKEKLENSDILTIWDIYLEDVLTGKKYKPEEAVQIKIPTALLGDDTVYDYLKVLHITDDGRIELLNCEIADGYIVFNAAEFSWYGVVGFMNGEEETVSDNLTSDAPLLISPQPEVQQNNSNPVVWIVIAAAGIAALAVLVVLKKRTADEE